MKTIALTQGRVALVDDADFERLNQWTWCAWKHRNTFYAQRARRVSEGKSGVVFMHQEVCCKGADHKNGNGLDNRRSNLRPCTASQNSANQPLQKGNRSGFKGVSWQGGRLNKWTAQVQVLGKKIHLGCYSDKEDAARAYDAAAREHFGEFAQLNFPGDE